MPGKTKIIDYYDSCLDCPSYCDGMGMGEPYCRHPDREDADNVMSSRVHPKCPKLKAQEVTCPRSTNCANSGKLTICKNLTNVAEYCDNYEPFQGYKSIPLPEKFAFLLKQRHTECTQCHNHPSACLTCVQNDEPLEVVLDQYDLKHLLLKALAFDMLNEGKMGCVFTCWDELKEAPQKDWAEIIVKTSAKSAFLLTQQIHSKKKS